METDSEMSGVAERLGSPDKSGDSESRRVVELLGKEEEIEERDAESHRVYSGGQNQLKGSYEKGARVANDRHLQLESEPRSLTRLFRAYDAGKLVISESYLDENDIEPTRMYVVEEELPENVELEYQSSK